MPTCSPPKCVCNRNMASVTAAVLCVMLTFLTTVAATTYKQFEIPVTDGIGPLQRMVQDESTGNIYVGSVNRLYKISSELMLETVNVTGPVEDNPLCRPPPQDCPQGRTTTDNVNKALIVDRERNRLITCGSIYQGFCQLLRLDSMSFIEEPQVEVVTNTEQGTNLAFIGPGPSGSENLLYTAVSLGQWIRGVPAVSKRRLSGPSQLRSYAGVMIPQSTFADTAPSNNFDINYVYGFASGGFSYFIATQLRDFQKDSSPLYTKIVRLCHGDDLEKLNSYIELPLVCNASNGVDYNLAKSAYVTKVGSDLYNAEISQDEDVLFVTFSADTIDTVTPRSVVCMYPIKMINEGFLSRILSCARKETDSTEIDWLGSPSCIMSQGLIDLAESAGANYCHTTNVNAPLGGLKLPIAAEPIYASNSTLMAIAATPHNEATVVLLGDTQGNLKKLRVQSLNKAQLYEEVSVVSGGEVIQNGLMFDRDKQYVYFMTQQKITRVPIETCELLTTCSECLAAGGEVGDPHCGWCPLQTSCTRRSEDECRGSNSNLPTNRWIDSSGNCIAVESIQPPSIPSHLQARQLTLNVTSLPVLNTSSTYKYKCVFGHLGSTKALPLENSSLIQCETPNQIPTFQGGSLSVQLSINATETGKLIVSKTFNFFKCSAFASCNQCVEDYECNWCIFENRCTGNASGCNASVAGQTVSTGNAQGKGKELCPRIDSNEEILIPAGQSTPYKFNVSVAKLPVQSGYECVLKHGEGKEEIVTSAIILSDTVIQCYERKYNYSIDESTVNANFSIRWNEGFELDNPTGVTVTLYKCGVKRTDCGKCLLADPKFSCGWCESSAACTMTAPCAAGEAMGEAMGKRWLSGPDLCPDPHISMFSPKTGHKDGGTRVTIDGFNLGQNVSDIRSIMIAKRSCVHVLSEYRAAERIVCMTDTMKSGVNMSSGPIKILIGRGNKTIMTVSSKNFSYVIPEITNIDPQIGPQAGETKMKLSGVHLNAGNMRTITVADEKTCQIADSTSTSIVCYTTPSMAGMTGPVVMTFDGEGTATSSTNFTYTDDPVVSAQPRKTIILSGGLDMPVSGRNLNVVQEPKMVFRIYPSSARKRRQAEQPIEITTRCTVSSEESMTCISPNLTVAISTAAFVLDEATTLPSFVLPKEDIVFVMDGVNMSSKVELKVYRDPEYRKFEEEGNLKMVQFQERKMLEIKGRYLKPVYEQGDVVVIVGNLSCVLLMQNEEDPNKLMCEAPDNAVGQTYDVVVHHGNLMFHVGFVRYLPEQLPLAIIIGAACGGLILVLVLLFIVCIWRRISANERRFKKMELQRDEMEMRVAQECKDAFAELQITVLNVSSDVEGSGIPFRSYRDYVARILFPDNPNHPVFNEVPVVKESISGMRCDVIHKGLVQFSHLISNQTFLTIFIRTLESQTKTLTLKDLTHIASLLIMALHNKMDFLTQAMKVLLQDHISKYVKEGRPQLLLRRSDAVVEKLVSHWLSILMYDSLKTGMGKPLFHLFYAIKQQIDKGPVDAMTGEARYGLSEMKVIRQQIDFKTLNIFTNSLDITSEPIQLKVLDCDTISQAKDKILDAIYKSCPFSKRPKRDDLDLEWSDRPGHGNTILLDDDGRSKLDGEWKRFNTLAHYQVPDGATLRLVRAQPNGGSLPSSPAKRYGLGTLQTSPATSASPIIDQERGVTYWHLVKHVESGSLRKGERDQKMMAEIYLPRLLTTKGTLQQFVDELIETIFNYDKYDSDVPVPIKYLFDFLDEQASKNGIINPDVPHAWKSNSLQLRFWINLINNPTILFDINKTDTVDAAVTIIGQTLIDACSVTEQTLTKDSPSNKLLYAKDIPQYKQWVMRYYKDISEMASVSDQDMNAMLTAHTNRYQKEFQPLNALNELYFCFVCTYKSQILQALDEDKEAQKQGLGDKMEDIFRLMADSA